MPSYRTFFSCLVIFPRMCSQSCFSSLECQLFYAQLQFHNWIRLHSITRNCDLKYFKNLTLSNTKVNCCLFALFLLFLNWIKKQPPPQFPWYFSWQVKPRIANKANRDLLRTLNSAEGKKRVEWLHLLQTLTKFKVHWTLYLSTERFGQNCILYNPTDIVLDTY